MQNIFEVDKYYVLNTYNRFPVAIKKGKKSTVIDINGKKYIDFSSGIAVNTFGHSDKSWKKSIKKQLNFVAHTSNLYYNTPQAMLAKMLCDKTGCKKVFFSNSGAEANECAIKAARKYSFDKYGANRHKIITLENSFHGRTLATLTATGQKVFHNFFNPFPEGFEYIAVNDSKNLNATLSKNDTAAVIIEFIQGESGVNVLDKEFIKNIYNYCKKYDILFIADEVQSGNGRTGSLYAFEDYDVIPDIVTTAKGLGGGLPIGATLFFKNHNFLGHGNHGSTFGGNAVCCAAAINVLKRLDQNFLQSVKEKGQYITSFLKTLKQVEDVSGKGLMIGVKVKDCIKVVNSCLHKGLLIITAKDRLRILPPLNITYKEIDKALKILAEALI